MSHIVAAISTIYILLCFRFIMTTRHMCKGCAAATARCHFEAAGISRVAPKSCTLLVTIGISQTELKPPRTLAGWVDVALECKCSTFLSTQITCLLHTAGADLRAISSNSLVASLELRGMIDQPCLPQLVHESCRQSLYVLPVLFQLWLQSLVWAQPAGSIECAHLSMCSSSLIGMGWCVARKSCMRNCNAVLHPCYQGSWLVMITCLAWSHLL